MLGIHRLSAQGAEYYLSDLAAELPLPTRWKEGPATWSGQAALGLGLHGAIDRSQLDAVLHGCRPASGQRLRTDRATVLGFDLTFSAPKTVSVLFALGGEEAARHVAAAHRQGVDGALAYLEVHGLGARRGSGEQRAVVPTTGFVAAAFTHGVNRNLDPHLHSHVVVCNLVHGDDGRWSACDQRGLSAHRMAASAIYHAQLRREVSTRLGLRWSEGPGLGAEIAGISPLLVGEFSSRAADIRRHMAERGATSRRSAQVAWAATRPAKSVDLRFDELSAQWDHRAQFLGSARTELAHVVDAGRRQPDPPAPTLNEHRFAAVLSLTPDGGARRRDVATAFATAAVQGVTSQSVEQLTDLWSPPASDGAQVGVAEEVGSLRRMVPGPHLLSALGPRPVDPVDHKVWREAARAIDDYRQHWGVTKAPDALGVEAMPSGIASLPTSRLVEHLRTHRHIELACQRLGWRSGRAHEVQRGR